MAEPTPEGEGGGEARLGGGGGSEAVMEEVFERPRPRRYGSLRSLGSSVRSMAIDIDGLLPEQGPPTFQAMLKSSKFEGGGEGGGFSAGLLAAVVGTTLEFYDFSVYAYFAPEMGKLFFPAGDSTLQAVKTFSVFAGGFLMRPLGSVLLGAIGDQYGTAVALKYSIALMTIPTVITGCLPTHKTVGPVATLLLTSMRLLQGLSVGGEMVGAILHTSDHRRSKDRRGFYCGMVTACGAIGNLLGSGVSTSVHRALTEDAILRWGWRVPYLCGSVLGFVGVLLRSSQEAPSARRGTATEAADTTTTTTTTPPPGINPPVSLLRQSSTASIIAEASSKRVHRLIDVFRNIRRADIPSLVLVTMLSTMCNLLSYTNLVWMGTYLSTLAHHPIPSYWAFAVVCTMMAISVVGEPLGGYLGDRLGARMLWIAVGLVVVAVAQPLLWLLLQGGSVARSFIFAAIMGPIVSMAISGNYWGWVTETLGASPSRYVSISVAYNIGAMIGGTYPMIASALSGSSLVVAPVLPISIFACLAVVVLLLTTDVVTGSNSSHENLEISKHSYGLEMDELEDMVVEEEGGVYVDVGGVEEVKR